MEKTFNIFKQRKVLFEEYLRQTKGHNGKLSDKSIKHYLNAIQSRISIFTHICYSEVKDIFALDLQEAKEYLERLRDDENFKKHCKSSKNVHISAINHYLRFIKLCNEINNTQVPTAGEKEGDKCAKEGTPYQCHSIEYKRSRKMREEVANENNYTCAICGFNFSQFYGSIGECFIEVHHKNPLKEGERKTTKDDLVCVCSNCHSMLHCKATPLSPEELKLRIDIIKSKI